MPKPRSYSPLAYPHDSGFTVCFSFEVVALFALIRVQNIVVQVDQRLRPPPRTRNSCCSVPPVHLQLHFQASYLHHLQPLVRPVLSHISTLSNTPFVLVCQRLDDLQSF